MCKLCETNTLSSVMCYTLCPGEHAAALAEKTEKAQDAATSSSSSTPRAGSKSPSKFKSPLLQVRRCNRLRGTGASAEYMCIGTRVERWAPESMDFTYRDITHTKWQIMIIDISYHCTYSLRCLDLKMLLCVELSISLSHTTINTSVIYCCRCCCCCCRLSPSLWNSMPQ